MITYRNDIDGLRAIAVIAVVVFHLGYLPNGYLGVDVFFVISGYLITSIIYGELVEKKFSILKFYERRIRRILPLLFFITSIALILGFIFMLPDDLENLAQSVIASNFSFNNILMLITSSDYWSVKNEYKPLMHTWSLGIEEQFYLLYPFILFVLSKWRMSVVKHFLLFITLISIMLFLFYGKEASKFYLLHFRFFELSIGGLFAILFFKVDRIPEIAKYVFYLSLSFLVLILALPYSNNTVNVIAVTILSVLILSLGKYTFEKNLFSKSVLQNRVITYIGKISFSLYLWHQVIFAFSRYAFFEELKMAQVFILVLITFGLSVISYHFLENIFRSKQIISNRGLYITLVILFSTSTIVATYIYMIGGVYKDYPMVGMYQVDNAKRGFNLFSSSDNIHISYNELVRKRQSNFVSDDKAKVLVVGNSFGRDVANIFLESSIAQEIEVRYFDINNAKKNSDIQNVWLSANLIVVCAKDFLSKQSIIEIGNAHSFDINFDNVVCFGTKDFGYSNGIHYNRYASIDDYSNYFTELKKGILDIEEKLKKEWGDKYISLISGFLNNEMKIRVFTNDGQFISPDCIHLTRPGAVFYAKVLDSKIKGLLSHTK